MYYLLRISVLYKLKSIKEKWKRCACGEENGRFNDELRVKMETVNALRVGACGISVPKIMKGKRKI